jgi:3-deoxy-D-manno-octulosonate 8-phosphate phosphatase (KDO 8-P phosphatase)
MFLHSEKAAALTWIVLDVDGVLTDGSVFYSNSGDEFKAFNIKDGLAIKIAQRAGLQFAIITGRSSQLLERRAAELGIDIVLQGRSDKLVALIELTEELDITLQQIAYMGDDLPDLGAIESVALGTCPADAASEVVAAADWVATVNGGRGAVRELIEMLLSARGQWDALVSEFRP